MIATATFVPRADAGGRRRRDDGGDRPRRVAGAPRACRSATPTPSWVRSCAVTSTTGARSPSWWPPIPRSGRRPPRSSPPACRCAGGRRRGRRAGAGRRPARGVPPSRSAVTPSGARGPSAPHAGVAGGTASVDRPAVTPRRSTSCDDPSAHPARPVRRVRHAGRGVQRPLPRLLRRRGRRRGWRPRCPTAVSPTSAARRRRSTTW